MGKKTKIAKIAATLAAANSAKTIIRDVTHWYDERFQYTATLLENNYIYPEIMQWLQEQTKSRNILFQTYNERVRRHYNSEQATVVNLEGHKVKVQMESRDTDSKSRSGMTMDEDSYAQTFGKNLKFTSHDPQAMNALERFFQLTLETKNRRQRKAELWHVSKYGWNTSEAKMRTMESIFLPGTDKENLIADLELFLSQEDRYETLGMPWHRGYLFHGPPGNGKSSLASAVARQFNMDLYSMPLSTVKDDETLSTLFGSLEPKSILLIEDVDIFSGTMARASNPSGPTLAGLLNSLDGIATPHGLIVIMTTNHLEVLDPALIRDGRVDYRVELKPPTTGQIRDMFKAVYDNDMGVAPRQFTSMAEVANVFKRNPNSYERARVEIARD